jgi:hypothetical protein
MTKYEMEFNLIYAEEKLRGFRGHSITRFYAIIEEMEKEEEFVVRDQNLVDVINKTIDAVKVLIVDVPDYLRSIADESEY